MTPSLSSSQAVFDHVSLDIEQALPLPSPHLGLAVPSSYGPQASSSARRFHGTHCYGSSSFSALSLKHRLPSYREVSEMNLMIFLIRLKGARLLRQASWLLLVQGVPVRT